MRIRRLRIQNVLGIDELDLSCGQFNLISGGNAAGKTSILDSIQAAIGGGHDATLIRQGNEKGEVVLVLEDEGGAELIARKTISEAGSRLQLSARDGAEIAKPQAFLAAMLDAVSANPVGFLMAPVKRKAEMLLEALPMTVTPDDIEQATGIVCTPASCHGHALDVIEAVRSSIFEERTGVNRAGKEKRSTVKQLTEALPPAPGGDPEAELAQVRREQGVLRLHDSQEYIRLRDEKDQSVRAAAQIRDEKSRRIQEEYRQAFENVNAEYVAAVAKLEAQMRPALVELATREEQAIQLVRAAGARSTIEQLKVGAEALENKSAELTLALDRLEALKRRLLDNLPIPGLEYREREFFYHGVALDHVNKAEQMKIALANSRLRAKRFGIVLVDGIEALDDEQLVLFQKGAMKTKLQYFVTRRTNGPIEVTVEG